MPETASKLPEEDRPHISPEGLRSRESAASTGTSGGRSQGTGGSAGNQSGGSTGTTGGSIGGGSGASTGTAGQGLYNPDELQDAEEAARDTADKLGSGYVDAGPNKISRLRRKVTRRRVAVGASVAGLGIGGGLAVFLALIPLKTEAIVTNLERHTFGSSQSALQQETNNILEDYLINKVLPSYKRCGTTVSKHCQVTGLGNNPVDRLYKTWANVRLENKLADDYGIEFRYNANGTWDLKAPGTDPKGDNIGKDGKNFDSEFNKATRGEMRQAFKNALEGETKWNKVWYRYKVGRLLEEKYGIKRCILFCGTRDTLAQKVSDQKIAYKLVFTQRVLSPYTQTLGIAMECLLDPACDPGSTQPSQAQDGTNAESAGAPESQFDSDLQAKLQEIAQSYGSTATPEELEATYNKLKDKGYQSAVIDEVLGKMGLSDLGSQILDKAAIIGWVNQAANTISAISTAGQKLTKLTFEIKGAAFVGTYMMARTGADELHTGHNTAAEVGSMNDMYGPATSTGPNDTITGGAAGAENTRIYHAWVENSTSSAPTVGFLDNPLVAKAYADSASFGPNGEVCNNGNHPQGNNIVCGEDTAGGGVAVVSNVSNNFNSPPLSYVTSIAKAWKSTIGGIFSFVGNIFGSIIGSIPGVSDITSFIAKAGEPLIQFFANGVISNDYGSNQGGGRTLAQTAGGAAVAGSDAASALGAQQVSTKTYASIIDKQQTVDRQDFARQSFFARMFSTSSQYSLVTKIAMDIPFGTKAMAQGSLANMLNPLGILSHSFASIFSGKAAADQAAANSPEVVNPYGVTLNAFPDGTIPKHASETWDAQCSDNASYGYMKDNSRNEAAASGQVNPDNGMPVYKTTNPCQLIMGAVGSAGGALDSSNLTQDDLKDTQQGAATTPAATTVSTDTYQNPLRDVMKNGSLFPRRIDEGVDYGGHGPVYAIGNGTVTFAGTGLWFGGVAADSQSVVYKLYDDPTRGGPAHGKSIYFSEACTPTVKKGDPVTPNTVICNMHGDNFPWVETGWAVGGGAEDTPSAHIGYRECATAYGVNFSDLMKKLGAPPGNVECGVDETLPNGWPTWN